MRVNVKPVASVNDTGTAVRHRVEKRSRGVHCEEISRQCRREAPSHGPCGGRWLAAVDGRQTIARSAIIPWAGSELIGAGSDFR